MPHFKIILTLLFFSFFCTVSRSQELWTDFRINLNLTKDIQIQPDIQVRFRHDPSLQSYANLYRLSMKYSLNSRWKLGGSFRLTKNQETENQETDEISTTEIPDRKRYT